MRFGGLGAAVQGTPDGTGVYTASAWKTGGALLDLQHPVVESVVLPLGVAFAITGAFLVLRRGRPTPRFAGLGVAIGFLLAIYVIFDGLVWPPRTGIQKLPYIATLAAAAGALLEGFAPARALFFRTGMAVLAVALVWLAWPHATAAHLGVLGPVFIAGVIVLWRVIPAEQDYGLSETVMLFAGAFGAAGAALNAGSLVLFQTGVALAAALGGFALWNWPRPRLVLGDTAALAATIGLLGITALMLMLSEIRPWALLSLLPVFFTNRAARLLPVPVRVDRRALEPVYVAVLSAPLVAAAILLSTPAPAGNDLYYY